MTAADPLPDWLCSRCGTPCDPIPDRPCPDCGCWWVVPRAQMIAPDGGQRKSPEPKPGAG